MRIRITKSKFQDKWTTTTIIFPTVLQENSQRPIPQQWMHSTIKPEKLEAGDLSFVNDYPKFISKLNLYSYENNERLGGELSLPLPVDILEFEALSYSIKFLKEKQIHEERAGMTQRNTWRLHECTILLKRETMDQLQGYLSDIGKTLK